MNFGNIKYHAIEDGEGCRTCLFVSGCRHHCKGCFQPQTWNFDFGDPFTEDIENKILDSLKDLYVSGLTILGGEPFEPENQAALYPFIKRVKETYPDKTIWMYSGYTFEELTDETSFCHTEFTNDILNTVDVLVDGEFVEEQKSLILPYRGSDNQRVLLTKDSMKNKTPVLYEKYCKKK